MRRAEALECDSFCPRREAFGPHTRDPPDRRDPMLAYEIGIDGARQLGTAAAVSVLFFPIFIVAIFILTKRMLSSEARA